MQTIQSVERALTLLETIAKQPAAQRSLRELASQAGLNSSTASRLLATLVSTGYVEQNGHKGAYSLGPMAYALSAKGPYRRDLIEAAGPHMEALAGEQGVHVLLVTLWQGKRFLLCDISGNRPSPTESGRHRSGSSTSSAAPTGERRSGKPSPA